MATDQTGRFRCDRCLAPVEACPGLPGLGRCATCGELLVEPDAQAVAMPPVPGRDEAPAGIRLGPGFRERFALERVLGRGAAAVVFLARQRSTGLATAVKFLGGPLDAEPVGRFVREGRALATLDHPAIVRVFELGEEDGRPYIALEYVDGPTLRQALERQGRFSPARCLEVIGPCLDALQLCHDSGLVHRDLKLDNILLTRDGRPKLSDFGMAAWEADRALSSAGQILGTPRTLAPEMALGKGAVAGSDIYSMGVVLFEMLAGAPPFEACQLDDLLLKHAMAPPPSLASRVHDLPPALDKLVGRCLAKTPEERFESPRALLAALTRAVGASSCMSPSGVRRDLTTREWLVRACVGLVALALVLYLGLRLLGPLSRR